MKTQATFALLIVALAAAGLPAQSQQFGLPQVADRNFVLVMSGTHFNLMKHPDTPLLEAVEGENLFFAIAVPHNAEPHVFHLHGHPWWDDSQARFIDAKLLMAGETHTFNVTAGSPGDWMYHCHFDNHFANGMWGILRIHPAGTDLGSDNPGHASHHHDGHASALPSAALDLA